MWNDALEISSKELGQILSAETLINYIDWTIPFTFHTAVSGKKLGSCIALFAEY